MLSSGATKQKTVLLALSGGVDSAVAAVLLQKRGFRVVGAFMKMWSDTKDLQGECAWKSERRDAYAVGARLGIPVMTLDFEEVYRREVLETFFTAYAAGETPNPDILCNSRIKFPLLRKAAREQGIDWVATGHYARIGARGDGMKELLCAVDAEKDQTYFLSGLSQADLAQTLFPIGDVVKKEVRHMARDAGLDVWDKRSTRGICFVGKVDMSSFLQQRLPERAGEIRHVDGRVIGTHQGIHHSTIGQRHGLAIGGGAPLFVVAKDPKNNILFVSDREKDLDTTEATIGDIHWIAGPPTPSLVLYARPRYRAPLVRVDLRGKMALFAEPQRAVTPGQQLVFYADGRCLGGTTVIRIPSLIPSSVY
jgi:tRNA-specific 2-thiouridylase